MVIEVSSCIIIQLDIVLTIMLKAQAMQGQFYERKIKNLSEDNSILHGQNTQLRKMLREAEQYKIKYELLVTSSTNQIHKIKNYYEKALETQKDEVISAAFKEKEKAWKTQLGQIEQKIRQEAESGIRDLTSQNIALRERLQIHQRRNQEMEMYGFKMKRYEQQNQALKEQLEQVKLNCEKQKEEELNSLRSHLTNSFREKTSNLRNTYDAKIVELEKKLIDFETHKDDQQLRMPKSSSDHHQDLKAIMSEKSQLYEQQLQILTHSLDSKNEEIKLLLEQKLSLQNTFRQEMSQQKQQVRQLENILLQKQKANTIEIHNIIQRMKAAKQHQIEELQREVESLKETLQRQRGIWNQKVLNHDSEVQELKRRFQEEKKKILQEHNLHKKRISDLSIRLRQAEGDRQMGETQMLINSIRDIDAKEDQLGGYENGVVFLQRQLKKCQIKLEEKSRIVTNLYKDINDIRNELNEEIEELKEKAKKEKKELTERIVSLQSQNKSLFDKMRMKEREDRKRERQTYKEKTELEENNTALKELVEQLQRDYKRVVEAKKGAESSYRSERQKNLTNVTDTSALKKQKWLQLQKQKNELQIIFRDKQQQLKLQTQQEIDQKTNIIDKLRQELELTRQQNQILKADNQRFLEELEMNKENNRIADYHKKIASLNLEIALTQNIYNSLVKAKSNVLQEQNLTDSIIGIDVRPEHQEREQPNELLMSFFPQQLRGKKG